jgi:hypothetical protein
MAKKYPTAAVAVQLVRQYGVPIHRFSLKLVNENEKENSTDSGAALSFENLCY